MPKLPDTITMPGAVDLHVHFREPGSNTAETIESGSLAAAEGGVVLSVDMPNNPGRPTWSYEAIAEKHKIIDHKAWTRVATYAGSQPESDNIQEFPKMSLLSVGIKGYGAPSTGNDNEYKAEDFRDIVRYWHQIAPNQPYMFHAGTQNLEDMIGLVAQDYDHPFHACHQSRPEDVELVAKARKKGLKVSNEVCMHHILKTAHDVMSEGWLARMQPPLEGQFDAEQLMYDLVSHRIDAVATDHAPHPLEEKYAAEELNPDGIHDKEHKTCFGVPGIKWMMPLLFYQAERGNISLERIEEVTSSNPARIIGVKRHPLTQVKWSMDRYRILEDETLGAACPFLGKWAVGSVIEMRIAGRKIYKQGQFNKRPKTMTVRRGAVI